MIEHYNKQLTARNEVIPHQTNDTIIGGVNEVMVQAIRDYVKVHGFPTEEQYRNQFKKNKIKRTEMAIYKDELVTNDYTGDGKSIPITVHLKFDREDLPAWKYDKFVTKVEYGNIILSAEEFKKADLGGFQEIIADVERYLLDNYYRS